MNHSFNWHGDFGFQIRHLKGIVRVSGLRVRVGSNLSLSNKTVNQQVPAGVKTKVQSLNQVSRSRSGGEVQMKPGIQEQGAAMVMLTTGDPHCCLHTSWNALRIYIGLGAIKLLEVGLPLVCVHSESWIVEQKLIITASG